MVASKELNVLDCLLCFGMGKCPEYVVKWHIKLAKCQTPAK